MPGDHTDPEVLQRACFRREARQAQRFAEKKKVKEELDPNPDDCAAWVLTPHVPRWLRAWVREGRLTLVPAGEGCWWVRPAMYPVLWIAANELPLRDELIPFLTARSGKKLMEFILWVEPRRTPEWLAELMYAQPEVAEMIESMEDQMSAEAQERVLSAFRRTKMGKRLAAEERNEGRLDAVEHLYARRLGRPVTTAEHAELLRRLDTLGPERISNVVLDLAPDALAAWLADPNAT